MPLYASVYMSLMVTYLERADLLWCLTGSLLLSHWYPVLTVSITDLCTFTYFDLLGNEEDIQTTSRICLFAGHSIYCMGHTCQYFNTMQWTQ